MPHPEHTAKGLRALTGATTVTAAHAALATAAGRRPRRPSPERSHWRWPASEGAEQVPDPIQGRNRDPE